MLDSVFFRNGWKSVPALGVGLWLALIGGGGALLARYEYTPGTSGIGPTAWPAHTHLRLDRGKATLVMTAHPKCPCTRASIAELASLLRENPGRLSAHILFFEPANADESWRQTASWNEARGIPGLTVSADIDGADAARFGGETSGDVLLFDTSGRLAFHGGITAARGKIGPNAGHTLLDELLAGATPATRQAPVFGCPLDSPISSR